VIAPAPAPISKISWFEPSSDDVFSLLSDLGFDLDFSEVFVVEVSARSDLGPHRG